MRLISQDGMIDVPYESTNVSISYEEKNKIIAWGFGCEDIIDFGTYSSHEKAKKIMEMLRDCYLGKDCGYRTEQGILYHSRNDFETKVFKFPDDSEVEV